MAVFTHHRGRSSISTRLSYNDSVDISSVLASPGHTDSNEALFAPSSRPDVQGARKRFSRYVNPWTSAKLDWRNEVSRNPFERHTYEEGPRGVNVVRPTWLPRAAAPEKEKATSAREPTNGAIRATWLGHASVLAEFAGHITDEPKTADKTVIRVLFDPMFSKRASPLSWAGPERHLPPPCEVEDLPELDLVCISHNHYDHLDVPTISRLVVSGKCANARFFAPRGCRRPLLSAGVLADQIIEKGWWEEETVHVSETRSFRVSCVPAQHNSSRILVDWNKSLWCGWVVQEEIHNNMPLINASEKAVLRPASPTIKSLFFGGDTGYRAESDGLACSAFKEIGERYGPFELALIPIWRGACLSWLSAFKLRLKPEALVRRYHCSPPDAVELSLDIRAKTSLAIHHSTFVGASSDESRWAIRLLKGACDKIPGHRMQFLRSPGSSAVGAEREKAEKNGDGSGRVGRRSSVLSAAGGGKSRFVVLDVGQHITV